MHVHGSNHHRMQRNDGDPCLPTLLQIHELGHCWGAKCVGGSVEVGAALLGGLPVQPGDGAVMHRQ